MAFYNRCIEFILILVFAAACSAQNIAITPVGGTSGTDTRPFMIGYEFSVSSQTIITGLGYLDAAGTGLNESHTVGIFNSSTGSLLVSATVPSGTTASLVDGFRITPVSYPLAPGTYVIAGQKLSNSDFAIVRSSGTRAVSGVTYIEERETQTSDFTMPATNFAPNEVGSFGPAFTVAGTAGGPVISGMGNGASFQKVYAPNTYVSIFGSGLSATTRSWAAADFKNGNQAPTSLDGVSVTVNGTPAYVQFVSPGQINILTPNITVTGTGVPVVVSVPGQAPVTSWLSVQALAPAFFTWFTGTSDSGRYLVAQHADYSDVGKSGLFPNSSPATTPAKAGETIILYGTGFGPTSPVVATGIETDKIYQLSPTPTATIANLPAQVTFAGLVPPFTQVYQINVTVPQGVSSGDASLVVNVNGTASAPGLITVTNP